MRHDYLPFGGEIASSVGGRSSITGYTATDTTRFRFTGKERDTESFSDFFQARYYFGAQGRFTSPDEFNGGAHYFTAMASANPTFYADATNPQTLNKYLYCYNNPLSCVDPDGHFGIPDWLRALYFNLHKPPGPPPPPKIGPASPPNPQQQQNPQHGFTILYGGAGNAEVGVGAAGAGLNASVVNVVSVSTKGSSNGTAASGAAIAYEGEHVAAAPKPDDKPAIAGAYAGGGYTFGVSNAGNVNDLKGPFLTLSGNIGGGQGASMNLSFDSSGTWVFQITVGPGAGLSGWVMTTNTAILECNGCK